jgi:hypothetical protein
MGHCLLDTRTVVLHLLQCSYSRYLVLSEIAPSSWKGLTLACWRVDQQLPIGCFTRWDTLRHPMWCPKPLLPCTSVWMVAVLFDAV